MAKREKSEVNDALRDATYTKEQIMALERANDNIRAHHHEIAQFLGSRDEAIFLFQVRHWWKWANRRMGSTSPFYKFIAPCERSVEGDSWHEELSMTRGEFDSVKRRVSTCVRNAKQARELIANGNALEHIVIYYVPSKGAPMWYFNEELYLKLRFTALEKYPNSTTAECKNLALGRMPDSSIPYSETPSETNSEEKEKIKKEKENADDFFQDTTVVEVDQKTRAKRAQNKKKANSQPKQIPLEVIKGHAMTLDFSLNGATILEAKEKGYEQHYIDAGLVDFKHFFTTVAKTVKRENWQREFLDKWLPKRDSLVGKNAKTTKNAGTERLERLQELTRTDIFDTTDFDELAKRAYESLYGADESNPHATG